MAVIEGTRNEKSWQGFYDFAVDGGVAGAIVLRSNDGPIPNGSVVTQGYIEVVTPPDSAAHTATISIDVEGAADTQAAAIVSGAPWSTTGRKSVIEAATGATSIKTTAGRSPTATVAVQNLTAGKFNVVLYYR